MLFLGKEKPPPTQIRAAGRQEVSQSSAAHCPEKFTAGSADALPAAKMGGIGLFDEIISACTHATGR